MRVKVCGITRLEDAQAALKAGADFLGFNFYPSSPRYLAPGRAAEIIAALPVAARTVGVFVNADLATVQSIAALCRLDYIQLHGDEPPEFVQALSPRAFKALRPRSVAEAEVAAAVYASLGPAEADAPLLLVDAYQAGRYGGTGEKGDWALAAGLASRYRRLLLAGGLTPENVAEAVRQVRPWGVDVASGVESAPGIKDHDKIRRFIQEAKRARL